MPKFNKDQIQKIVLSSILLIFLLYAYLQFGLGPLQKRDDIELKAMPDMQTKIDAAKLQIRKGKNAQDNAATAVTTIKTISAMIPNEAPIAWLPPLLSDFFARQGIEKVTVRPASQGEPVPFEGLSDYKYYIWSLDAPNAPFLKMAAAIANLENTQPLLSIRTLHVEAGTDNPEIQKCTCEIKALLK